MSVFLGGGGSASDEGRLWSEAFRSGQRVVVWPFAQAAPRSQAATVDWMRSRLADHGVDEVEGWADDQPGGRSLVGVDVVAIPGGNTFLLLHELRRRGLIEPLRMHLADGGRLYGGSAGAVIAGADIGIASIADENAFAGEGAAGLDLLGGADVLPHFTLAQEHFARERVDALGRSIVCVPERSGVIVDRAGFRCAGPESVLIFTRESQVEMQAGSSWSPDEQY